MPRVKKYTDSREEEVMQLIGAIMGSLKLSYKDVADMTGIKYTTLLSRIGRTGNIGDLRLCEYWAIMDAAKRKGCSYEGKVS